MNLTNCPLLKNKFHEHPAIFTPENLLREARRQRGLQPGSVPELCVLDPDGDLVRHLRGSGGATRSVTWACYHTELYEFIQGGRRFGVVGCAVGGPFAVLVAEELFACGCRLLVSITSSGQIVPVRRPPYFVLATRALRDEGTSYHYLPAKEYVEISPPILTLARQAFAVADLTVVEGTVWTTDAPFRETEEAIAFARGQGLLAVEMETAALYAFAAACQKQVLCLAHVTNCMARSQGDFEKGEADGSLAMLRLLRAIAQALESLHDST